MSTLGLNCEILSLGNVSLKSDGVDIVCSDPSQKIKINGIIPTNGGGGGVPADIIAESIILELATGDNDPRVKIDNGGITLSSTAEGTLMEFVNPTAEAGREKMFLGRNNLNELELLAGEAMVTNLNLMTNGTHQPTLKYSGVDPLVSEWGEYEKVVQTTGNQEIAGIKTLKSPMILDQVVAPLEGLIFIHQPGNILDISPAVNTATEQGPAPALNISSGLGTGIPRLLFNGSTPKLTDWGGGTEFLANTVKLSGEPAQNQTVEMQTFFSKTVRTDVGVEMSLGDGATQRTSFLIPGNAVVDGATVGTLRMKYPDKFELANNNAEIMEVDGVETFFNRSNNGAQKCYYKGGANAENTNELMNRGDTDAAVLATLDTTPVLQKVKGTIVEGGYDGTIVDGAPYYDITHKNNVIFSEKTHTIQADGTFNPTDEDNNVTFLCDAEFSESATIQKEYYGTYYNYTAELEKMFTSYTRNIQIPNASIIPGGEFELFNTASTFGVHFMGGTLPGSPTTLFSSLEGTFNLSFRVTSNTSGSSGWIPAIKDEGDAGKRYHSLRGSYTGVSSKLPNLTNDITGVARQYPNFQFHATDFDAGSDGTMPMPEILFKSTTTVGVNESPGKYVMKFPAGMATATAESDNWFRISITRVGSIF